MLRRQVLNKGLRFQSTVRSIDFDPTTLDLKPHSTVFSMIQPTGRFHLGNYLGAVKTWKDITTHTPKESNVNLIFGVADLHAITVPKHSAAEMKELRYEAIASILSTGIDSDKAIVYHQSAVQEHAELNWILSCISSMGYLNRMTQWKSKSSDVGANASLGLYAYPVLQAADILLYKSNLVPVGDDQSQHLELCRSIADSFNHKFGKTFPLPNTIFAPTKKILNLKNPAKKMSKSDPDKLSCLYITDEPEVISKKIKKAVTDSIMTEFKFDPENRPGVSNLINIISGLQMKSIADVEAELVGMKSHKEFKDHVTGLIIEEFTEPRLKFNELLKDREHLQRVVNQGNDRARAIASKTIKEVKQKVGLD
ncbi:hypothetical protein WICPIJ_000616 [Wickerhamomyces pijperi]|uniref:Tryptophan--tRNA ligase, mitochondrial n=1 Tax=Wickerhamomyces pijperi TaxID=599730 RepID=A0A9P8QCH1_WICPI|nr:hypothetical protein WICPIJ_000616 [Wickerhamomyces pijperi]